MLPVLANRNIWVEEHGVENRKQPGVGRPTFYETLAG